MKKYFSFALSAIFVFSIQCFAGYRASSDSRSRIFWDACSLTTVFHKGNYSRIIQLDDGRLLAAAEAENGISISYSMDNGSTWSAPECIAMPPENVFYAVPDLIQLSDGTIIIGFNPRPLFPYSPDRLFGIRVMRSTDNGMTWEGPVFVYDACHTFGDGCWEPSFVEFDDGQVHCYFADESRYTESDEQCISVSVSEDKGLTWSIPEKVCYRAGSRDGMPVPIILHGGDSIAVIIEDNGWPGYRNFVATTVRTSVKDRWRDGYVGGRDFRRNMIFPEPPDRKFISAAPYLRKLPWGETVASYQGNHSLEVADLQYFDMFVAVGDCGARNFKSITNPFNIKPGQHSIWNSVSVLDDGTVLAAGSIGKAYGRNSVKVIKGYPVQSIVAEYEGNALRRKSSISLPESSVLYFGHGSGISCTVSFSYDKNSLSVSMDFHTDISGQDCIPGKYSLGIYLGRKGHVPFEICTDKNVKILWRQIGIRKPSRNTRLYVNIELLRDGKVVEIIPDTDLSDFSTWLELTLQR